MVLRTTGVANVVEAARTAGVRRVVQESVSMLYADQGDEWITEQSPVDITPMTEPMEGPGTEGAGAKTPKPEKPGKAEPVAMPPTQAVSSPVAANAIPVLLAVAVVAMFVGALLRVSMRLKART